MRSRKLIASLIGVVALFTLAPLMSAQTFQTLFDFNLWDGKWPRTSILDKAGNLYGTTQGGGTNSDGVIFKLAPNADGSWTRTILHNFSGLDGASPFTSLTFDQAGNLYTTPFGGASGGYGVVFQLVPNSNGTWRGSEKRQLVTMRCFICKNGTSCAPTWKTNFGISASFVPIFLVGYRKAYSVGCESDVVTTSVMRA